jgi:hypothetical protein
MHQLSHVRRVAVAAALYFLSVFGLGLVLGPIRVLWLEALIGRTLAVLCEMPFLLGAMFLAARWTARKFRFHGELRSLGAMGVVALVLQQIADFAVGRFWRSSTFMEQVTALTTPEGLVYAALLVAFAMTPVFVGYFQFGRAAGL